MAPFPLDVFFFVMAPANTTLVWLGTVLLISTKWHLSLLQPPRPGHPWSEFVDPGPGPGVNCERGSAPLQDDATKLAALSAVGDSAAEVTGRQPLLWLRRGACSSLAAEEPQTMYVCRSPRLRQSDSKTWPLGDVCLALANRCASWKFRASRARARARAQEQGRLETRRQVAATRPCP
jgi:hypothetical protein